jgi:hypothetical protein
LIGSWLLKIVVGLALAAFLVVELGSPLVARATLDSTAHDAAGDAAHEYLQNRDSAKAQQVALDDATNGHAKLTAFAIDEQGVVRVTLSKQAKSYVLHRIDQLKGWYDVTVTASATPK